jgi:competence ComEA-like helix-hairpin-helix protein
MNAAPPSLGVAASPAQPPAATNFAPRPEPTGASAVWPRSAQIALAVLLGLAAGLLAWHAYGMQRLGSRPTELDTVATPFTKLDLNRADRPQLLQLPGVGDNLARRIENYRVDHHGFRNVEELRQVSGIGPAMLERLRPFVYVERYEGEQEDEPAAAPAYKPPAEPAARKAAPMGTEKKTITKKTDGLKDRIDVNQATATQLQQLPGVGPKLAGRIIDQRDRKPFQTVDELRRVPGIGPKTLENLRPYVTVEPSANAETNQ